MNRFVITNPSACIGCRTCEVACSLAHPDDTQTPVKAGMALQGVPVGASFHFLPRIKAMSTRHVSSTVQCRHCDDAPCVNVCPTNALVYQDGTVQLLDERCIGCKTCVIACPLGAMSMATKPAKPAADSSVKLKLTQTVAHKCDLCVGSATGPACITACPTKALHLMEPESIEDMLRVKREQAINQSSAGAVR